MSKIILFAIIVAALVWWYRRRRATSGRQHPGGDETVMVRCAQCNLYLPPTDATRKGADWYCARHG